MKIPNRVIFIEEILGEPKQVSSDTWEIQVVANVNYKKEYGIVTSYSRQNAFNLKVGQEISSNRGFLTY